MRATICVSADVEGDVRDVDAWFAEWRERLTFISDNKGCGCCVHVWDVDGPLEAIALIPEHSRAWEPPES